MSRHCQVTGRTPRSGNHVSHSHTRTKRRFVPNVQRKRFWLPSENRWIRLRVSAKGMKVIDKRGIERVVRELRSAGERV
jgi:large subunit ribosomal protein L28